MNAKFITQGSLFILAVFLSAYMITRPIGIVTVLLLAVIIGTILMLNPRMLIGMLMFSFTANLIVPFFGGAIQSKVAEAMFLLLAVYGILTVSMTRARRKVDMSDKGMLLFLVAILLVMVGRGFGMRILGSESYGGRIYISMIASIVAYRLMPDVKYSARNIRSLMLWMTVGAILPVIAVYAVSFWPTVYPLISNFMELRPGYFMTSTIGGGLTASEQFRVHGGEVLAGTAWPLMVALMWRKRRRKWMGAVLLVLLGIVLLSGFRSASVAILITSAIVIVMTSRAPLAALMMLGGIGIAGYFILLIAGDRLPWAAQRSLSFIPGIEWNHEAMISAKASIDFRLGIWKMAMQDLPRYLVVGRGLLLEDVYRHAWFGTEYYLSPEFYYAARSYHSGPLSLLLDTGILGFIGFMIFQIGIIRNALSAYRKADTRFDPFVRGLIVALLIRSCYSLFSYMVIYGDLDRIFTSLILSGLLVRIVSRHIDDRLAEASAEVPVEAGTAPIGLHRYVRAAVLPV